MDNDKNQDFMDEIVAEREESNISHAARARNRTVMLTPEVTGEVRARLAQEASAASAVESGFESVHRSPPQYGAPAPSVGYQENGQFGGGGEEESDYNTPVDSQFANTSGETAIWAKETPIVGFLVSYDSNPNGDIFVLRKGRLIVTCEAGKGGNFLVIRHNTVSAMHAILRISSGGDIQVLDQLSEYGTKIIKHQTKQESELSGEKGTLQHGDQILFGERRFYLCSIPKEE